MRFLVVRYNMVAKDAYGAELAQGRLFYFSMNSSIFRAVSERISGSFSFSSGVKRERTKSTSPSLFRSSGFPVPRRIRG